MRYLFHHLICNLLLPAECPECGQSLALDPFTPTAPVSRICDSCLLGLLAETAPAWTLEGIPGVSAGWYEGPLATLLKEMKEEADRGLLLRLLQRLERPAWATGLLVPVPPDLTRRRLRGWDPVGVMAGELGHNWGLEVACLLHRPASLLSQKERSLGERLHSGVWQLSRRGRTRGLDGERVLLVDDVTTSGATLLGCARVLQAEGAFVAGFLTLLRTAPPDMKRSAGF